MNRLFLLRKRADGRQSRPLRRRAPLWLFLSVAAASGGAQAVDAATATVVRLCEDSRREVARNGEAVLVNRGEEEARFVRDRSFCHTTERAVPAFIRSQDRDMCFVGYRCQKS